jgi:hypothetical protein
MLSCARVVCVCVQGWRDRVCVWLRLHDGRARSIDTGAAASASGERTLPVPLTNTVECS